MKQILTIAALILTANSAFATCFNFINGKGPEEIAGISLAAQAKQVCVSNVGKMTGGSYTSVDFSDAQGELAGLAGQVTANGRCLGFCKEITLDSGNVNGENVNAEGIVLTFKAEPSNIGAVMGTLSIKAGRDFAKNYLIMQQD